MFSERNKPNAKMGYPHNPFRFCLLKRTLWGWGTPPIKRIERIKRIDSAKCVASVDKTLGKSHLISHCTGYSTLTWLLRRRILHILVSERKYNMCSSTHCFTRSCWWDVADNHLTQLLWTLTQFQWLHRYIYIYSTCIATLGLITFLFLELRVSKYKFDCATRKRVWLGEDARFGESFSFFAARIATQPI